MGAAEGEEVLRIRRTRSDNNVVLSFVKSYLRPEIGQEIEKEDLLTHSMLYLLRNKLGLPLRTVVQYIMPAIADYEIASALSLSISSPVLYLETIISDEGDFPVDLVQTFYRSDRVKYTFRFDLDETKMA